LAALALAARSGEGRAPAVRPAVRRRVMSFMV
jgi:hypothetical protein